MLHHQSAVLFEKIQPVEEEVWDDDHGFGWESEYDDEAFFFTQSVLDGDADDLLTNLFDERVRRDEGRPVTLAELLSAFKDAADDAEALKQREINRLEHERELSEYLQDVGGRMHNEDLEGDIERCWTALKATCEAASSPVVPLVDVMARLRPLLVSTFGASLEDPESEAFVASFIAGLFLTHRRMASITQEGEAVANIMIEDLWPDLTSFSDVLEAVEALMAEDAVELDGQTTGSEHEWKPSPSVHGWLRSARHDGRRSWRPRLQRKLNISWRMQRLRLSLLKPSKSMIGWWSEGKTWPNYRWNP